MTVALLTDADRFPFDEDDRAMLATAGVELRELPGHASEDIIRAARGADAMFVYSARLPSGLMDQRDSVRLIARCGAGYDGCLGLRAVAHDPEVREATATRAQLLGESDFISIHVPLTDETRHSIGEAELSQMKAGTILINTARGAVVDTPALVAALRSGHLAGAGIDVYDDTPLARDHPLRSCDTAVLTPHSAAYTEEGLAEVRKRPLTDALRVLRGEPPRNPIP